MELPFSQHLQPSDSGFVRWKCARHKGMCIVCISAGMQCQGHDGTLGVCLHFMLWGEDMHHVKELPHHMSRFHSRLSFSFVRILCYGTRVAACSCHKLSYGPEVFDNVAALSTPIASPPVLWVLYNLADRYSQCNLFRQQLLVLLVRVKNQCACELAM